MSWSDGIALATLAVGLFSGLGIPLVIYFLKSSDSDRAEMKQELHGRLDHLDECLDDTRQAMLSRMVTKEDMANHRIEVQEIITRIRDASSKESLALHERIYRLENRAFGLPPNA
jgi:hypothetical protein